MSNEGTQKYKNWRRPAGPPRKWRIIDSFENTQDGGRIPIKLSIQEVPEDRYEEVLEHMKTYFIADEPICKSSKITSDQAAMDDFRLVWLYCLEQGITVGAFKLDSNGQILNLAGVNLLLMVTDTVEGEMTKIMEKFTSAAGFKIFKVMYELSNKFDVRKIFGIKEYMSALGLSIAPAYRGHKLGVHLLETRRDIGQAFGICATSTVFTAKASQIQAERAGFETVYAQEYSELYYDDGKLAFPGIESKSANVMVMKLI